MNLSTLLGPDGWDKALVALGFTKDILAGGDDRRRWLIEVERTGQQLQSITPALLTELCAIWPGASTIEVMLGNQCQVELHQNNAFQQLAGLSTTTMYRVRLTLDKSVVLQALGTSTDVVRWFVSPQAQQALTEFPHPRVEQEWFDVSPTSVVVLPHMAADFVGPFLTVVGGPALAHVPVPSPSAAELALRERQLHWRQHLVWEDAGFAIATPIELEVEGTDWRGAAGQLLASLAARHVLLSTADRVRRGSSPGSIVGEYRGAAGATAVELPGASPSDPRMTAHFAHELTNWIFDEEPGDRSWLSDRVALTRTVAFEQLRRATDAERSKTFVDSMERLSTDSSWHWRLFISGALESHVAAVDDFRSEVSSAVDSFASTTSDVVDSTIDGMKAAVATVLASFIGAALATDFKETVFRVGMGLYAIYIVTFPGAFGLWSKYDRFRTASASFDDARRSAIEVLGEERVRKIEGDRPSRARRSFWVVVTTTAVIFLTVAVLALISQRVIPDRIG